MIEEVKLGAKLLGFGRKFWPYIVVALIAAGLIFWALRAHSNAVKAFGDERYAQGVADQKAAQATAQATANGQAETINSTVRKTNDETNRHIAGDADALRLRGPGKAICASAATAPSRASEHVAAGRPADAAVAEVPDSERPQLIALPFADAISFAEQHDRLRAEALSWRESDDKQRAAAAQSQAAQPKE